MEHFPEKVGFGDYFQQASPEWLIPPDDHAAIFRDEFMRMAHTVSLALYFLDIPVTYGSIKKGMSDCKRLAVQYYSRILDLRAASEWRKGVNEIAVSLDPGLHPDDRIVMALSFYADKAHIYDVVGTHLDLMVRTYNSDKLEHIINMGMVFLEDNIMLPGSDQFDMSFAEHHQSAK